MKHTLRLSKQAPQFDRLSYRNKAAYWLVYPGATIIIVAGAAYIGTVAAGRLGAVRRSSTPP